MNAVQQVATDTVARLVAEGKTEAEAVAEVKQYWAWLEQICDSARGQVA